MYICVDNVCVCIYIYTHTNIYIYIYTYICTHICLRGRVFWVLAS